MARHILGSLVLQSLVFKSLAIGGNRVGGPVLIGEQIPEIDPGALMIGIMRDDGTVHLLGFRRPRLSGQGCRQAEARLDQIGIGRERAAVRRFGLGEARGSDSATPSLPWRFASSAQCDSALKHGHCAVMLPLHGKGIAQRGERRHVIRIEAEHSSQQIATIVHAALSESDHRGEMECRQVMIRLCPQGCRRTARSPVARQPAV